LCVPDKQIVLPFLFSLRVLWALVPNKSILPFFCVFFKFLGKFVFRACRGCFLAHFKAGLVLIFLRVCEFGAWLHVSGGAFRGSAIRGNIQVAGLCGLYLLYSAKTTRRETVSGCGLLCDSGGVCLSLSACRTIGAGLPLSVWYRGAAGTFEQVFGTSVRK
jgi:hypothetical protein